MTKLKRKVLFLSLCCAVLLMHAVAFAAPPVTVTTVADFNTAVQSGSSDIIVDIKQANATLNAGSSYKGTITLKNIANSLTLTTAGNVVLDDKSNPAAVKSLTVGGKLTVNSATTINLLQLTGDLEVAEYVTLKKEISHNIGGQLIIKPNGYLLTDIAVNDVAVEGMTGDGSSANPYKISADYMLHAIRHDKDAHYELTSDVDYKNGGLKSTNVTYLPRTGSFTLGQWDYFPGFTGTIDGKGHTISNVWLPSYGLFDGHSLTVKNVNFENISNTDGSNIHSLMGFIRNQPAGAQSIFENITITNYRNRGNDHATGIVGSSGSRILLKNIAMKDAFILGFRGSSLLAMGWENSVITAENCTFENVTMPLDESDPTNYLDKTGCAQSASLLFMHKKNPTDSSKQTLTVDDKTVDSLFKDFGSTNLNGMSKTTYQAIVKIAAKKPLTLDEYNAAKDFLEKHKNSDFYASLSLVPEYIPPVVTPPTPTPEVVTPPKTGDTANPLCYIFFVLASFVVIVGLVRAKKAR